MGRRHHEVGEGGNPWSAGSDLVAGPPPLVPSVSFRPALPFLGQLVGRQAHGQPEGIERWPGRSVGHPVSGQGTAGEATGGDFIRVGRKEDGWEGKRMGGRAPSRSLVPSLPPASWPRRPPTRQLAGSHGRGPGPQLPCVPSWPTGFNVRSPRPGPLSRPPQPANWFVSHLLPTPWPTGLRAFWKGTAAPTGPPGPVANWFVSHLLPTPWPTGLRALGRGPPPDPFPLRALLDQLVSCPPRHRPALPCDQLAFRLAPLPQPTGPKSLVPCQPNWSSEPLTGPGPLLKVRPLVPNLDDQLTNWSCFAQKSFRLRRPEGKKREGKKREGKMLPKSPVAGRVVLSPMARA